MATAANQSRRGGYWILSVLILGLPSVLFILLHQGVVVYYYQDAPPDVHSPVWLDRFLMWPVFVTGMLGGFATFGAFLVTLIGSFRRGVSGKSKVVMWGIAAVSVL